jgi:hypothetical protein
MTDLRSAAKQALEALTEYGCAYLRHQHAYDESITALRAALDQPEQAPAAWINPKNLQGLTLGLYGYAEIYADESQGRIPLYTHPHSRTWRGLTEEELNVIYSQPQTHKGQYARAIEAALRSKNHE